MDTVEFLRHVLPHTGPYCIAIYKPKPDGTKGPFYHYAAADIAEAAAIAAYQDAEGEEVYFAIGALIKARVWDEQQGRLRTSRSGDNIRGVRTHSMDLDAGNGRAYATTDDALNDLVRLCKTYRLPKPTVVQSGFGLHVYWTLSDEVPEAVWEQYGAALDGMAKAIGVKSDSGRTIDSSSVLRVVGTHNNKYPERPLVTALCVGADTDTTVFHNLLRPAGDASPLDTPAPVSLGNNTNRYESSPLDPKLLVSGCAAFRRTVDPANQLQGKDAIPEPAWMCAIMLAVHCKNGRKVAHTLSDQDPRYDAGYVDKQFDRWTASGMGPATCSKYQKAWADHDGSNVCDGCPSQGKITSPAVIARYVQAAAPLVVVEVEPDGTQVQRKIPNPPEPYQRTVGGLAIRTANTKTGADESLVFCRYDMYPSRMQYDEVTKIEDGVRWRVNMPHEGWVDLDIPHVAKNQLPLTLAKRGIYLEEHHLNFMASFMSNYVRKLQAEIPREMAYAKMGWRKEGFIVGDTLFTKAGTEELHCMSRVLDQATQGGMTVEGDLDEWKKAAQIYNREGQEPFRVFLYSTFGSVLYHMTGQVATCLNASGIGGIGKSTVMDIGAAIWGNPKALVMRNQTRAAAEIIANGLHHLPTMIDEITTRDTKEIADLIFTYSSGKGKLRSQASGGIRGDTATWSNLCLTNANTDVYASMASVHSDSAPHLMRLIQLEFPGCSVVSKLEADAARMQAFENYGHAGRDFAAYIAQHETDIRKRVSRMRDEMDTRVNAKSEERYWTAWIAAAGVAAEIAFDLGLLAGFPISDDIAWMGAQISTLRTKTQDHIESAEEMLASFFDEHLPNTLILSSAQSSNIDNVASEPRGELMIRMELDTGVAIVSRRALQSYCVEHNINLSRRMEELWERGVVLHRNVTHVLGAHTKYAGGRVRCVVISVTKLGGKIASVATPAAAAALSAAYAGASQGTP
jgi:uncharacterized protein DUF927